MTARVTAILNGKHRKGAGRTLRAAVVVSEVLCYGFLRCYCCGKPMAASDRTLEHIVPRSRGGKTTLSNLALSHSTCNERRGDSGSPRVILGVDGSHSVI